jgi:N-acyl homoserine lactone hydrolase
MAGALQKIRLVRSAIGFIATVMALGIDAGSVAPQAQRAAQGARPTRMYVLDGGTLLIADPKGFGVTKEEVNGLTDMPVPSYLIVHEKGSLFWDAGLGDDLLNRPASETARGSMGQVVTKTLKAQLAEIGFTPEKITFLAMSHMHFDHVGNANDYASATWIVQKAERDSVWGDAPLPAFKDPASTARFSALKNSKTLVINGDHDVFGDGTVVIKSTPGHTPGHQSLFVRLAKTGPIVISGDLYHYPAELTLKKMPAREVGPGQTAASREALEAFIKQTGAQLWIQHDQVIWGKIKKSPEFYE